MIEFSNEPRTLIGQHCSVRHASRRDRYISTRLAKDATSAPAVLALMGPLDFHESAVFELVTGLVPASVHASVRLVSAPGSSPVYWTLHGSDLLLHASTVDITDMAAKQAATFILKPGLIPGRNHVTFEAAFTRGSLVRDEGNRLAAAPLQATYAFGSAATFVLGSPVD